jgi:DNA-binding MarR family transcriptional regulator
VKLLYLPFYLIKGYRKLIVEEGVIFKREVEKIQEATILIPAFTRGLLIIDEDYSGYIQELPMLGDEEAELLRALMDSDEGIGYRELREELGWSIKKISNIVHKLSRLGLVESEKEETEYGRERSIFYTDLPDVDELMETSETILCNGTYAGKPEGKHIIYPVKTSANEAVKILKKLYDLKVKDTSIIYLPVYRVKMVSINDNLFRYIYLIANCDEEIPLEIPSLEEL